jgi:hypothetical protein
VVGAKNFLTRNPVGARLLLHRYRYLFHPEQLWALCEAAERCAPLGGAFAEIGAYNGCTTVYLNLHLWTKGFSPTYYSLDTFTGFTDEDVAIERERGKTIDYSGLFANTSKECFERTMQMNGVKNVIAIQADATTFDYTTLKPLSFALVDLDLYRPVQVALAACWELLEAGGMIIVDDCSQDNDAYDGALQAYVEFCNENDQPVDVRYGKLGYLSKPAV